MSTQIHNGYRIAKPHKLNTLHNFTQEMRISLHEVGTTLVLRKIAAIIGVMIDTCSIYSYEKAVSLLNDYHPNINEYSSFLAASSFLRKQQELPRNSHLFDSDYDFECNFSLIPSRGNIFCLLYENQEAYRIQFEANERIQPYAYWNNTDRPDDITSRQWSKRGKDWNLALPGMGVPSRHDWLVRCFSTIPRATYDDVLPFMPTWDERLQKQGYHYASDTLFNQRFKGRNLDEGIGIYREVQEYLDTREGKAHIEETKLLLKEKLLPAFTQEILRVPLCDFFKNDHL